MMTIVDMANFEWCYGVYSSPCEH